MTSFFGKLKGLLLSYPDKEYIDWQMSGLKQSVKENHIAPLLIQNLLYRSWGYFGALLRGGACRVAFDFRAAYPRCGSYGGVYYGADGEA